MKIPDQEFYTVGEVAEVVGRGQQAVRQDIRKGLLAAHRRGPSGSKLRVVRNALVAYVARLESRESETKRES